ncbi:hypothetical protein [Paenibacillus shenyangensis]|uniref:hypothetical protein n=1 Tax=Paenibacillus sp. A9 TaxID=1284352 RepID=UPI000371DD41|nr:hypothetical protein [Paenibacillus sp. A9]
MGDELGAAALGKASQALYEAGRPIRAFAAQDNNRFYMLHGTLTDSPVPTTAGTTYQSLQRTYARAKQIVFTLSSGTSDGTLTVYWSRNGITFSSETLTAVQEPVSKRYQYEKLITGSIIAAYYVFKEGAAAGSIFGGIGTTESVVS